MTLPRYIPTRMLEACDREAKACFAQPGLGLQDRYQSNGAWKIYPCSLVENESVSPCQINIVLTPMPYEQGVSALNNTMLDVAFFFHFPINDRTHTTGGNTYLDHIWAFREWLFKGGSWAARIAAATSTPDFVLPSAPIEDPDNEGQALGTLVHFEPEQPFIYKPNSASLVVPVGAIWQTRETAAGELV